MNTSTQRSSLYALCSTLIPGFFLLALSGCAAGVVGAVLGAAGGGGGGGGGAAPAVAALTLSPSIAATSGTVRQADPEARVAELAIVNLPERYQVVVDDVAIDPDNVEAVEGNGETFVRFPIPDHRFTYRSGVPVGVRDLRVRAQKVTVKLTDLDSGAQTKVDFIYLPPKLAEVAPQVFTLVNGISDPPTLSEFVQAVADAGGTGALPDGLIRFDPEVLGAANPELADEVGTVLTIQGEFYDFDDPVSLAGSDAIAPALANKLERTQVFLTATENGAERILGELTILKPVISDDVISVFVPSAIVVGVSPDAEFSLEIRSPNGAPEKQSVFVAPPYAVEVPRKRNGEEVNCVVLEENGNVTIRWANNCDGPPLLKDTADVSVQVAGDFDPRYPKDGNGAAAEGYPAGFLITRRRLGDVGGVIVNARDSTARIGERCADGVDNDGDGLTDVADPDCRDDNGDFSPPETACDDGNDNDGDGAIDARDSDCTARDAEQFTDTTAGDLEPGFYCYDVVGRLFVGDKIRNTPAFQVVVPIFRPDERYDLLWDLTSDRSQGLQAKVALERLGRNPIVFEGADGLAKALCGTNRDLVSQLDSITLLYGEVTADGDTDDDEAVITRPAPVLSREDIQFLRNEYLAGGNGRLWLSGGNVFSSLYETLSQPDPIPGADDSLAFVQQVLGVRELGNNTIAVDPSEARQLAKLLTRVVVGPGEEDDAEDDDFALELGVAGAEIACGEQSIENSLFDETGRRDDLGVLDLDGGSGVVIFRATPGKTSAKPPKPVTGVLNSTGLFTSLVTSFSPEAFGTERVDRVFRDAFRSLGIEFSEVCDNSVDDDCDGLADAEDPDCAIAGVADRVTRVSMSDSSMLAALDPLGAAPVSNGGPEIDISGRLEAINGGTARIRATGSQFAKLIVFVDGLAGFWELTLPGEGRAAGIVDVADILLTFASDLEKGDIVPCRIGAVDSQGRVGPYVALPFAIVESVRSEGLQVSISWDVESDVDLIVLEPTDDPEDPFFQIDFGSEMDSPGGGRLDLDSNPDCRIDGIKNENISWPPGRQPRGLYFVFVDLFNACDQRITEYVVTVRLPDGLIETFTGVLSLEDVQQPRQVTTFTLD